MAMHEPQGIALVKELPIRSTHTADSSAKELYVPLDRKSAQIRLFNIAPGAGNQAIECTFEIASLDDDPEYEAISYVWGDATDTGTITLDGHLLSITRSLFDVLNTFRHATEYRRVWADAISIHQADLKEKSYQVLLMSRIYRQCSRCLIWLGKSEDIVLEPSTVAKWWTYDPVQTDSFLRKELLNDDIVNLPPIIDRDPDDHMSVSDVTAAFSMIHLLAVEKDPNKWPLFARARYEQESDPVLIIPCPRWDRAKRTLLAIMMHPWFSRIWTIQEAVLPKQGLIHVDRHQIDLDTVLNAIVNAREVISTALHQAPGVSWCIGDITSRICYISLKGSLHEIAKLRAAQRATELPQKSGAEIFAQLYLLWGRNTSNLLDAVYGFQSIVPMILGNDELPDYRLSVAECYARATKQLIKATDFTYMKMMSPRDNTDLTSNAISGLPTWAYDYAHSRRSEALGSYQFWAGGRIARHTLRQEAPSVLVLPVEAILKGVITKSVPYEGCSAGPLDVVPGILQRQGQRTMMIRWREEFREIYDRDRVLFWRTMFFDTAVAITQLGPAQNSTPITEADLDLMDSFLAPQESKTLELDNGPVEYFTVESKYFYILPRFSVKHQIGTAMFSYGTLGLGCGNKNVREGDVLAILKSSVVPVVLRPIVDSQDLVEQREETHDMNCSMPRYQFVGPCYVDGIMFGEAVNAQTEWTVLDLV